MLRGNTLFAGSDKMMTTAHGVDRPAVLITGTSSGIGAACATDLAGRGFRVFAGVRKASDAQRLQEQAGGAIEPVLLDVTDSQAIAAAVARLETAVGTAGLAGLVCNAGIIVPGPLELLSTSEFRRQLEVNVLGTHAVTQAFLPLLRTARGRIVIIGSISGIVSPPFMGAYAASKHALEAVADALRVELRTWQIRVSIIEPDIVATPVWVKLDNSVSEFTYEGNSPARQQYEAEMREVRKASAGMARGGMPPSRTVAAVRHALCARRPRPRYPVGLRAHVARWGACLLPVRLFDWILLRGTGLR